MFDQRVRFKLNTSEFGELELTNDPFFSDEVQNWKDIPKTITRGKKSLSFITQYIESLTFVKEGASYLRSYFNLYSPNGQVFFTVEIKNPRTDVWEVDYSNEINMQFFEDVDERFTVKVITGALDEIIDAQMKEKFELDRITFKDGTFTDPEDINGNRITNLEYDRIFWSGRKLLNRSLLKNIMDYEHEARFEPTLGINTTNFIHELDIEYESDDLVQINFPATENARRVRFTNVWELQQNQIIYTENDIDKTLDITVDVKGQAVFNGSNNEITFFIVRATRQGTNDFFTGSADDDIVVASFDGQSDIEFRNTVSINLKKGEVLAFVINMSAQATLPSTFTSKKGEVSVFIKEDSTRPPVRFNTLTFNDALKRNIEIITGNRNNFRSDFFEKGEFKDLCISSGKMIRNLPKVNDDNEPLGVKESITTSLDDLLSSTGYFNLGWGVEEYNGIKKFTVEDLKHFFRNKITVRVGEVSDYKESYAEDYHFKSADFGNDKAGDYEEQFGRFETNAKNTYGFPTNRVKEIFDGTSKLRSDLIGAEIARRAQFKNDPDSDTQYDNENFLFDCKNNSLEYLLKKWQDVLVAAPKKVYDPDSTGNHKLTPLQSLFNHGWYFNSSLYKFPEEYIRYSSSTGFPEMIMQFPGEPERAENGNFQGKELERGRIDAKYINFSIDLTYEIKKQIEGSFFDNGREVPNLYGLVEFTYKNGQKQYGWILDVEMTRKANFRLIKAQL